ncbi:CDP-alcohol phosphatidyltransferase family protein [Oscillospiraceae bacterium PP1C4]
MKTEEVVVTKMNIPNTLTAFRILLIPSFLWTFLTADTHHDYYVAASILTFSGLSDIIDGYIARRFDMITRLGKILDPIADKLTLAAVMIALWVTRPQLWPLYAIFIFKELLMLAGGLRLYHKKMDIEGAQWFGKLATVMFYVVMIVIAALPELSNQTILKMLLFLLVFILFALLQYSLLFKKMIKKVKE